MFVVVCLFFKQKTAYDMRISDWSSDVFSSELHENEVRKDFTPSERVAIEKAIQRKPLGDQSRSQNFATVDDAARMAGFGNRETARQARTVVEKDRKSVV